MLRERHGPRRHSIRMERSSGKRLIKQGRREIRGVILDIRLVYGIKGGSLVWNYDKWKESFICRKE